MRVTPSIIILSSITVLFLGACDDHPLTDPGVAPPPTFEMGVPAGDPTDLGSPVAGSLSDAPVAGPLSEPLTGTGEPGVAMPVSSSDAAVAAAPVPGVPDLVWQNPSTGQTTIWHGTGYQDGYTTLMRVPIGWEIAGAGDFTGNGSPDLVWQNVSTGDRSIWHMDGRTWTGDFTSLARVVPDWRIAAVADLTGNGTPDLVWENRATGDRSVWHMDGTSWTGSFTRLPRVAVEWRIAGAADLTGNGDPDLVWQNIDTGHRSVWHMDGTTWSGAYTALPRVITDWRIAAVADFTRNGNPDLVWENLEDGKRSIWHMDGTSWAGDFTALQRVDPSWRIPTARVSTGSSTPMAPGKDIALGLGHTCMLTLDGAAYCWGANNRGQLGTGDTVSTSLPVPVAGGHVFAGISAGWHTTCAWKSDGAGFCWGDGTRGALGNGGTDDSVVPVPISGGLAFSEIEVSGQWYACGRTTAGEAHCWGWNNTGRLGTGDTISSQVPVPVVGDLTFASISVGLLNACGLEADGTAYCWGSGVFGTLGTGDTNNRFEPTPVTGDHTFTDLVAGATVTCGVDSSGDTRCWGQNFHGTLGMGSVVHPLVLEPQPIVGGHSFVTAGAGNENHILSIACGLEAGGKAYCWGPNGYGGLGSTTAADTCRVSATHPWFPCTGTPTPVQGGLSFETLVSSAGFACGLTTAGEAYCWGRDTFGQLGSGRVASGVCNPLTTTEPCAFAPIRVGAPAAAALAAPAAAVPDLRAVRALDRALEVTGRR